jgi:hypothetical protein
VGERSCGLDLAVEEHPLVGDEHVVVDDEADRVVAELRDGHVLEVDALGLGRDVHDPHSRGVDRNGERDRELLLAGLHRLGRDGHQLVPDGGARDVELRPPHHDPVPLAVDDPEVGIGVVLLAGPLVAVSLGVGDGLHEPEVLILHLLDVGPNQLASLGPYTLDPVGRGEQGHEGVVAATRDEIDPHPGVLSHLLDVRRGAHVGADRPRGGVVVEVVRLRDGVDGPAEDGVLGDLHPFALVVHLAPVGQRTAVVVSGQHGAVSFVGGDGRGGVIAARGSGR